MVTNEEYYYRLKSEDLYIPEDLSHTHLRLFSEGHAFKIRDIITGPGHLLSILKRYSPSDVFYTPSKFSDPTVINKKSDKMSQNLFLYANEFVIDIDSSDPKKSWEENLAASKNAVLKILGYLKDGDWVPFMPFGWYPFMLVFSGNKGWHMHFHFDARPNEPDPIKRELRVKQIKSRIIDDIYRFEPLVDTIPSWDTRRIIRLPGSVHGKTGNLVEIVKEEEILGYRPKHVVEIEKKTTFKDYI